MQQSGRGWGTAPLCKAWPMSGNTQWLFAYALWRACIAKQVLCLCARGNACCLRVCARGRGLPLWRKAAPINSARCSGEWRRAKCAVCGRLLRDECRRHGRAWAACPACGTCPMGGALHAISVGAQQAQPPGSPPTITALQRVVRWPGLPVYRLGVCVRQGGTPLVRRAF